MSALVPKRRKRSVSRSGPAVPASMPTAHHVSVVALAMGGVLACLADGALAAAPVLPQGTVPIKWSNGAWSTDPAASLVNTLTGTGVNQLISQQASAAVYNWDTFNIANGSSVYFNMAQGSGARALNRVMGSSDPSVIQGRLGSNGQVYLINQNGILFGSGAQVNVAGLVASALNIDTNDFLSGLQSINTTAPTFFYDSGGSIPFSGLANAKVIVDNGASLSAPGGRLFLFGGRVSNAGRISAPDGQVALAGGSEIYLALPSIANLRGLLIDVTRAGAALPTAATSSVTNETSGVIETARGNTTLTGYFVNQNGRISATTSATANGSIYLQARDSVNARQLDVNAAGNLAGGTLVKVAGRGGELVLGAGSVTEVRPDGNGDTTDYNKTFYASSVDMSGRLIRMQSGASVVATGGTVTAAALTTFDPVTQTTTGPSGTGTQFWSDLILNGNQPVAQDSARFVMESGASIDVSGAQAVPIAMERNSVTTALLGANDFKDSPEQRDGVLYRQKITFDIRNPVPILGDTSAYVKAIQRSAAEMLSAGGNIKVLSSGDVALAKDATLNISGGSLAYQGGYVNTTKLVSNGKIYDIANAPKDLRYDSVYGTYTVYAPKFGSEATQVWTIPTKGVYQPAYIEGKSGGNITLMSRSISTEATIKAGAVSGPYQRDTSTTPSGGTLTIGAASDPVATLLTPGDYVGPNIRIASNATGLGSSFWSDPAGAASGAAGGEVVLGAGMLNDSGLSSLKLYTNGSLVQEGGADLRLPAGGGLTAIASSATLNGNITAHGGQVGITATATKTSAAPGNVSVTGRIDTSGGWINDSALVNGTGRPVTPLFINGGSISLQGDGINVGSNALLDVSGGARLGADGKLTLGNGGKIALARAGTKFDASGNVSQAAPNWLGGALRLDGQMRGAALGRGGSLAIAMASPVRIGGTPLAGEMGLDAAFFGRGGFADYNVASIGGLTVASGTQLAARAQNLVLSGNYRGKATGSDLGGFTTLGTLPDASRAPVNLTLQAVGDLTGNLRVESGASISTDPGATVNLVAGRQMTVDGSISAPAGAINLSLRPSDVTPDATLLDRSIWLGSGSVLSTAGTFVPSTVSNGLAKGNVLDGGTISIDLTQRSNDLAVGLLVAREDAVLDVRGASAIVDLGSSRGAAQPTLVGSKGGSINIKTLDGGLFDATVLASGGTPNAAGGQFSASIAGGKAAHDGGNSSAYASHVPSLDQTIALNSGATALVPAGAQQAAGLDRTTFGGKLGLRADKLNQAGLADISLNAEQRIQAADSVSLSTQRSITLNSPNLDVAAGRSLVASAPYVKISNVKDASGTAGELAAPAASGGTASLTVNASLIDLQGLVSLTGVGNTALNSAGDIRLQGVWSGSTTNGYWGAFNTGGNLTLTSAQTYPTTGFAGNVDPANPRNWSFNLNAPGHTISFASNGAAADTPLSAGGSLLVTAQDIVQGGILRAPLGRLSLVADNGLDLRPGSVTSVSAGGKLIPYGSTVNGQDWTYDTASGTPLSANGGTLIAPSKSLNLSGTSVNVSRGATLDVSGGGDLYGYEFVPGVGGSTDVLANTGAYAIVPSLGRAYAPYDPQIYAAYAGNPGALKVGDTITLGVGSGLSAGTYTLLPARYALLPGAYLVKPVSGYQDMRAEVSVAQTDGSAIVSGYRGTLNTGLIDSRSSGWLVTPGAVARQQAEYRDSGGNSFFAGLAAAAGKAAQRNGADAGIISINAGQNLALDGTLNLAGDAGARGAAIDIASAKIAVTGAAPGVADSYRSQGYVVLDSAKLNAAKIESLMIGGNRSASGATTTITTDLVVDSADTALSGSDIILASTGRLDVRAGSSIVATPLGRADSLQTSGAGALLRVAGSDSASVTRTGAATGAAALSVGANTLLGAQNAGGTASVILDSTNTNTIDASATINASTALISAASMSAGAVPPGAPGLRLGAPLLGQLGQAQDLTLKSYSSIDFTGAASLGSASLKRLTLDAYALTGRDSNPAVDITAGQVTLTNSSGASALSASAQPLGSGTLDITATDNLVSGAGNKTLQGFANVNLTAGKELRLQNDPSQGTAKLSVSAAGVAAPAALTITAARIGAASGADQAISTTGHLEIRNGLASGTLADAVGTGAKLALSGKDVRVAGTIDLPAGSIGISATGTSSADNVLIASGTVLRATGTSTSFDGVNAYAPAGRIDLNAAGGSVRVGSGTLIDVSGASGGGDAGTLTATARNGSVQISSNATLKGDAAAGYRSGSASFEAKTLGRLDAINIALNRGGFAEERDFRAHTGGLVVGSAANAAINARNVSLEADGENDNGGNINIAGKVGGAFAKAGEVRIASAAGVMVSGDGQLVAASTGAGKAGGTVYVSTTSASAGNLSLGGRGVDVSAGAGGTGGTLWLRAPQDADAGGNAVGAVAPISAPVTGASSLVLEGVKTYTYAGNVNISNGAASSATTLAKGTGSAPAAGTILGDAMAFMANAAAVASRVGRGVVAVDVRAGTEVKAGGDISIANSVVNSSGTVTTDNSLNFYPGSAATSRPEQRGGVLTLRAGGNLNIGSSITDGFNGTAANSALQVGDGAGQTGVPTWSYRLVGGSDLAAADTRRTNNNGTGDVLIGNTAANADVIVRTATGNIEIAAGRNVQLRDPRAVVYTTGAGTSLNAATQTFNAINATVLGTSANPFTSGGGSLRVEAKNDVIGPTGDNQAISNWLFRRQNNNADNPQTAWWARYDLFRQNFATFGGGDITVRAGHDITDVSVSAATNARLPANPATVKQGALVVQGGGDLDIRAGRNIAGGMYYEGRGTANLQAGGAITGGTPRDISGVMTAYNPILALQDGTFNLTANGSVGTSGIFNPTLATAATLNSSGGFTPGAFSSYADTSAVNLFSLRGDVIVDQADISAFARLRTPNSGTGNAGAGLNNTLGAKPYTIAPGNLNAVALSGDVSATATMMPAAQGQLNLLAGSDVTAKVTMLDRPAGGTDSLATITNPGGLKPYLVADSHGYATTHLGDSTPARLVALAGDLTASGFIGKSAHLVAGRDIKNLALTVQNVNADDQTVVSAGRDYIGNDGVFSGDTFLRVDGPGQVLVKAGRNVDLGISGGLVTSGNTANRFLSEHGASLTVIAGVSGKPDYAALASRYLDSYGLYAAAYLRLGDAVIGGYLSEMAAYVRQASGNPAIDQWSALERFFALPADSQAQLLGSLATKNNFIATLPAFRQLLADYAASPARVTTGALAQFRSLSAQAQQPFLQRILYAEVGISASDAAGSTKTSAKDIAYQRGYDAIATFFPGSSYKGDLLMYSSQIKTQDGGDIAIFVPGGMVNAGQVVPNALVTKPASDLGILTVADGDINAIVKGDFQVNQSRVFTLAGGGLLMWSSEGSLDAGRGAKTAGSAPAPVLRLDNQGNLVVDYSGAVSGSGLAIISTDKTKAPGRAILAAPKGSINFNDAGGVFPELVVTGAIIRGADNVQVSGSSTGLAAQNVQSAPPPPPNLGDESRKAVEQVSKGVSDALAGRPPVTSNVFVGFGE